MLDDVVALLACPVCGRDLARGGGALRCAEGHGFDIARQGYANLTAGRAGAVGDTEAMVAARVAFLAAGHYDPLTAAVVAACAQRPGRGGAVLDAGAGPGRHLRAVLDALHGSVGIALDASVPAARRAARAHPRMGAVVADTWRGLPVRRGAVALVLNVFAPRNPAEFARVLAPGGSLVVVGAGPEHLEGLVDALGLLRVGAGRRERLDAELAGDFTGESLGELGVALRLTHPEVLALVGMGPNAWHTDPVRLAAAVARLPEPVAVTAAFEIARYRLR